MMIRPRAFVSALILAIGVVTAGDARAQATGSGALAARSVLRIKGCGTRTGSFGLVALANGDGTWSAQDTAGTGYAGTYTMLGSTGRKLDLQFDASTMTAFVSSLSADAADLCGLPVTVTSSMRKKFLLRINRRGTRAKLVLVYVFTGSAGGRQGSARYQLRAAGPWTAAP
jgi:hypothetical protein